MARTYERDLACRPLPPCRSIHRSHRHRPFARHRTTTRTRAQWHASPGPWAHTCTDQSEAALMDASQSSTAHALDRVPRARVSLPCRPIARHGHVRKRTQRTRGLTACARTLRTRTRGRARPRAGAAPRQRHSVRFLRNIEK